MGNTSSNECSYGKNCSSCGQETDRDSDFCKVCSECGSSRCNHCYDHYDPGYQYASTTSSGRTCAKCVHNKKQQVVVRNSNAVSMSPDQLPQYIAEAIKSGNISKIELERMSKEDRVLWEKISVHFKWEFGMDYALGLPHMPSDCY